MKKEKITKCDICQKPATTRTKRGGNYCDKCFHEGLEREKEAMGYYDGTYF